MRYGNCWTCPAKLVAARTEAAPQPSRRVFVVYGHDANARTQLEAMLRRWRLEPVILDQLPSEGQTLIEKLEKFSSDEVGFAVVLGLNERNVSLRRNQFRLADQEYFALALARRLVAGKVRNQRTLLQRNHIEPDRNTLAGLKEMAEHAERASRLDELLGIGGNAARLYFGAFAGMIKPDEVSNAAEFSFDFDGRNRRPPRDPINAMLSLAYSLLAKDLTVACYAVGFDPYIGYYHQPRFGRPALALDLMEPFRPLIADSGVLTAVNTGMVTHKDFVRAGNSVALTAGGRKGFLRAYELRMDTLVTHPLFDYRVSYRRLLEIQARLLARVLDGEVGEYPVFTTR